MSEPEFEIVLHAQFLQSLHEEKVGTQEERAKYVLSKLGFVAALFGLGSVSIQGSDFGWLLYLVPIVAIGYDLHIRAADSSIKRIGAFLRDRALSGACPPEAKWEQGCVRTRDRLAPGANTLFTILVTAAAALPLVASPLPSSRWFWPAWAAWLAVCSALVVWQHLAHRRMVRALDTKTEGKEDEGAASAGEA